MPNKKWLRQQMKEKMRNLSYESYIKGSKASIKKITLLPEWKEAKTIGVTMSTRDEIDTASLIHQAWEDNKQIAVPKADPKDKTMEFRVIRSFEEVLEAFAGIREPILERTSPVEPDEIDLLIVPGLVFNEKGYRIGFGGGFYDRFLADYHGKTVSLAFDFQVMKEIPTESFDLPVQIIVTNERVIRTDETR